MKKRKYQFTDNDPTYVISQAQKRLARLEKKGIERDEFEEASYHFYSRVINTQWKLMLYPDGRYQQPSSKQIADEEAAMLISTEVLVQNLELIKAAMELGEIDLPLLDVEQEIQKYADTFNKAFFSLTLKEQAGLVLKGTTVAMAALLGGLLGALPGFILGAILITTVAISLTAPLLFPVAAVLIGLIFGTVMLIGAIALGARGFSANYDRFFGTKDMMPGVASAALASFGIFPGETLTVQNKLSDSENETFGNDEEPATLVV